MKKKLLSLTLSALLLCSVGITTPAKGITQNNKLSATVQSLTHVWEYSSTTLSRSYTEYQRSNGMIRSRTVNVYNKNYVCYECGATKGEFYFNTYGDWSPWSIEM